MKNQCPERPDRNWRKPVTRGVRKIANPPGPDGNSEHLSSSFKLMLPESGRLSCLVTTRQLASTLREFINDPVEHGSNQLSTSKIVDDWLNLIPTRWDPRLENWSRHLSDVNPNAERFIGEPFRLGDEALCLVPSPREDEPTKYASYTSLLRLVRLLLSVSSTLDIFRQEKFDRFALESFRCFMIKAVGWHIKDELESKLKAYFADMLIRIAPLSERDPNTVPIFSGHLNRYCNLLVLRARGGHLKSQAFVRSLLESKRLWFQLSEARQKKSMEDHKKRLGTALPPLSEESKYWLQKATDAVFKKGIKYVPGSPLPTRSAGYTVSRAWGGAFEKYSLDVPVHLYPNGTPGLELHETIDVSPELGINDRVRVFDEIQCMAIKLLSEDVHDVDIRNDTKYRYASTSLTEIGKNNGLHRVRYQSLPEPGKFRVITAGPESLYLAVRPVQQWMIEVWKHFPLSTMSDTWVDRFRQSVTSSSGGIFVSGDYEATTDLLAAESTQVILERFFQNVQGIPVHMKKWMEWCLRPAIIEYPDKSEVHMKNGQLMGNPLSFVFLCIANLSTLMRTASEMGLSWEDVASFINGDDIFFEIPSEARGWPIDQMDVYQRWKSHASELNLKLSLGKNLVSENLAMINNVMIRSDGQEVQYLRTALSIGHRVKSDSTVDSGTMPAIEDKLWLGVNPEASLQLVLDFRRRFKSKLVSIKVRGCPDFVPNWFFPKSLGGYGLTNYTGKPIEASLAQRKVAGYLMRNPFEQFRFSYLSAKKEIPQSVKLALRDAKSVIVFERSELIGPLTEHEDYPTQAESLFKRFLGKHRWIRDIEAPANSFSITMPKDILDEKYIASVSKIMNYRPPHYRVVGVEKSWGEPVPL